MRSGLRQEELFHLAALMRGGASWEEAKKLITDVAPEVLDGFRTVIEERAAEPGPVEKFAPPDELDGARAFFDRPGHEKITVHRSIPWRR